MNPALIFAAIAGFMLLKKQPEVIPYFAPEPEPPITKPSIQEYIAGLAKKPTLLTITPERARELVPPPPPPPPPTIVRPIRVPLDERLERAEPLTKVELIIEQKFMANTVKNPSIVTPTMVKVVSQGTIIDAPVEYARWIH